MKLNQTKFFITGILLILLCYFSTRIIKVVLGQEVSGTFVFYVEEDSPDGKLISPIIEYKLNDSIYRLKGEEGNSYKPAETVPVLIQNNDTNRAIEYTIGSFWLFPMVYWILPLTIWTAFSLTWLGKKDKLEIRMSRPFFKKTEAPTLRE